MPPALAIHGGAGLIRRATLSDAREAACREALAAALGAGWAILDAGGDATDAVEAAVVALEEAPTFNAGRGAVLAAGGRVELDAAFMDGQTRQAGAVTACTRPRNPIRLARAVARHTPHVLLAGPGADALADELGLEVVPEGWHITEERRAQYEAVAAEGGYGLDHGSLGGRRDVYGTVGAVAADRRGHVAAATSTGGMVNKRAGRVGDSPILGAGTFAWDRTCAVSGTGHGEAFLRLCAAHRVSDLIELSGLSLREAAFRVIHDELPAIDGEGGLIAVGPDGALALPFNTGGMFRAWRSADGGGVDIW